ncbi:MAG: Nif3-like dinuclear metal center hexameric protein [Eubacteriales bacterium]|nr:Nif3-like dinuclear metal center hexameric protein [Eubacteriales bacterium]
MAISFTELLTELRTIAPRELEEDWDNGGLQINMAKESIEKILVCLEITEKVIEEAVSLGVDYIVTHHPLLFHKLDVVDANSVTGNYVIKLIRHGITVYSAHTSFDYAFGGNNDYLAELLNLNKVHKLKVWTPFGDKEYAGRVGTLLKPMSLKQVGETLEDVLKLKQKVRMVGDQNRMIKTIGLCTGAGGDSIEAAIKNDCDLFITGDVRHHEAQMAKEMGICLIDAGHYGTESIFAENFANQLRKATDGKVEIVESNILVDPFDSMVY